MSDPLTYDERVPYACDVCGNVRDEDGTIAHGKGCYVVSEDGGGESSYLPAADARGVNREVEGNLT